jgi:hypothetical protein
VQGWDSGVKVYGTAAEDRPVDVFQIIQTGGSAGALSDREIGRIVDGQLWLYRTAIDRAEIIEDAVEEVDRRCAEVIA